MKYLLLTTFLSSFFLQSSPIKATGDHMQEEDQPISTVAMKQSTEFPSEADNESVWSSFSASLQGFNVFTNPTDETMSLKERVTRHSLRVAINLEDNLTRVRELVAQYHLTSFFGTRLDKLLKKVANPSLLEILAAQGNRMAFFSKLKVIPDGQNPFELMSEAVEEQPMAAAIEEKRNKGASPARIAFDCNPQVAKNMIERDAVQGNQNAIIYKIDALWWGWYPYERDPQAARALIESLVDKNIDAAIERKIDGLTRGRYGYKKDLQAARDFIESLVERNNEEAIKRKIEGLYSKKYGYEENLSELKTFLGKLALSNNPLGLYFYVLSLKHGLCGFGKDPELANRIIQEKGVPF